MIGDTILWEESVVGIQAVLLTHKSGSSLIMLGKWDGTQLLVLIFLMKILWQMNGISSRTTRIVQVMVRSIAWKLIPEIVLSEGLE